MLYPFILFDVSTRVFGYGLKKPYSGTELPLPSAIPQIRSMRISLILSTV